jgi:preprotein translocase subunit SecE
MNQANRNFFWIICIVTVIGAIYWSVISVLQQPRPLFIAFLAINIVSLIVNIVCWVIDSKKANSKN